MREYDVIVIGAGNSGLSCAATVSKAGLKTLVIDRNLVPGGCATSFVRGRFEFEPSLHALANIGTPENPGTVMKMFREFGLDIPWYNEPYAFRTITNDEHHMDVTIPVGRREFIDSVEKEVPGSKESVTAFFELADKANQALAYLGSGKPDFQKMAVEHTDFLRMCAYTAKECMDALNMPEKAQNILGTYWSYMGAPLDQIDCTLYAVVLQRYVDFGLGIPLHRSHELSLSLAKAIYDNGGEIWYHSEVTEILTQDGAAIGVKVGEETIYGKYIVANMFPEVAFRLMKQEDVSIEAIQLSNSRKLGVQFFTVYLGLNRTKEELGINDYTVFLYEDGDSRKQYDACSCIDKCFCIVNCLNCTEADASPEGTCTLFFTTFFTEDQLDKLSIKDYFRFKEIVSEHLVSMYEEKLDIQIRDHIEEIVVSSPVTFSRYMNTPNGTPYGYELSCWDSMIPRIMNSRKEQMIPNLFFVGAHGERSDGYSSTYANGTSVAKKIIKEVRNNG